jgi:hypothetical protein
VDGYADEEDALAQVRIIQWDCIIIIIIIRILIIVIVIRPWGGGTDYYYNNNKRTHWHRYGLQLFLLALLQVF